MMLVEGTAGANGLMSRVVNVELTGLARLYTQGPS